MNSNLFLSLRGIVLFWDMDDVIPTIVTTFSLQKFIGCNGALSSKVIRDDLKKLVLEDFFTEGDTDFAV